jgi:hypothetical protein
MYERNGSNARRSSISAYGLRIFIVCPVFIALISISDGAFGFKPEDMGRLSATKQCPFCDLTGADLRGFDVSGGRLPGARLSESNLSNARLSGANLRNADMRHVRLIDTDLSKTDLSGADLSGADLTGASLKHAKLAGTELAGAKLTNADLTEANLSGAYWVDGRKCGEGSIGECKKDTSGSERRPGGRGAHGLPGVPGGGLQMSR